MIKKLVMLLALAVLAQSCIYAAEQTETKSVLDKIESPADVKQLSKKQMEALAKDIRKGILTHSNTVGGHLGSDLGIVEATIALHYVFNSPQDKIIFDVSHQTYPHKMLTGRKEGFTDPLNHKEISGYSNPAESEHDFFVLGHTSTSLSLASGMAKARNLKGEEYNIVALIGDGSLIGGEALEGLNNAAVLNSNFIIVINDNEMSIAPPNGGLYKHLKELRKSNGKSENNIFKALGYDYYYLENGNNITKLIEQFNAVKDTKKPTVVHIHTQKGHGYIPAERNKEQYHWILPNTLGTRKSRYMPDNYNSLTADYLYNAKKKDNTVVAVTPATPGATGFTQIFRKKMGENYVDVDIAEQHAVGYVSGLAKNGGKPVLAVMSSFIQRAYDQLSQDFALNNAPATILVFGGGISGADMTHLGIFDIPLISNIPNIVYLAPTCKEEYVAMLDWAIPQDKYSVAIKVPAGEMVSTGIKDTTDYSILNKFKVTNEGARIAIIGAGNFYRLAEKLQQNIKDLWGINATLINPIYLTGLDTDVLEHLKSNHDIVITLEDGCLDGGFGQKISAYYSSSKIKVLNYGAKKEFTDRVPVKELYERYRLTPELIMQDIDNLMKY